MVYQNLVYSEIRVLAVYLGIEKSEYIYIIFNMLEGDEGEVIVKGEEIEVKLTELLPAIYCKAEDESDGCGAKFIITVVSR